MEVGIDKKYQNKKWWYYSEKNLYFSINYSIAQRATLACYKLLNAKVGIFLAVIPSFLVSVDPYFHFQIYKFLMYVVYILWVLVRVCVPL